MFQRRKADTMFISKKKLKQRIDCAIIMALSDNSCDECGQVFASEYFLTKHRKETGHKKYSAQEHWTVGIDRIFEEANNINRYCYWKEEKPCGKP